MIIENQARLVVMGDAPGATAAYVTSFLGLQPSDSGEAGDLDVSSANPRPRTGGKPRRHSMWAYECEDAGDSPDETGFASLRRLLSALENTADAVKALNTNDDYDVRIWWAGFSDSEQAGFVLEADLAVSLGVLGIPLYGTAYLSEDESDDAE